MAGRQSALDLLLVWQQVVLNSCGGNGVDKASVVGAGGGVAEWLQLVSLRRHRLPRLRRVELPDGLHSSTCRSCVVAGCVSKNGCGRDVVSALSVMNNRDGTKAPRRV